MARGTGSLTDVGTRPRKKRMIKKGTASHRGGSIGSNPRTGGGVKWYKDRLVRNAKKDWETVKKWWQQ